LLGLADAITALADILIITAFVQGEFKDEDSMGIAVAG
jgi:hypothetical protein